MGGSFEGSYAGARIWYMVPVFDVPLMPVFVDPRDAMVDIDSFDSFLLMLCSEGRRGGSAGDLRGGRPGFGEFESLRAGGRGGSAGWIFGVGGAALG